MKIYFIHASSYPNYENNLYIPIRQSELNKVYDIVLPHESSILPIHSKEIISSSDLIIAEVSYPSTGLGIELGWVGIEEREILCIHKAGRKPSSSLKLFCSDFLEYENQIDMISKINNWVEMKWAH